MSESHKFVRLYPLGQGNLRTGQNAVDFQTANSSQSDDEGVLDMDGAASNKDKRTAATIGNTENTVDHTPNLISDIIAEAGVLLPSTVSQDLVKI